MEESPMLLLSRPILDTDSRDDEFNPYDLIDEHHETYIHASSLNEQSVRTSPASAASQGRGLTAGILEHFQHCAIPFAVRLPALLIAFGTLFLALSVVLWLSHRHYDPPEGFVQADVPSGILVREPASPGDINSNETVAMGLIISSVITQFVGLTAPILLGTVAYRLGFDWCKASQELAYEKLPTQEQYGLIIDMFTMASIPTMWRTSSYLLQRTVRRAKAPRVLLRGFSLVCILFALTRVIGLADVALHSTTSSIVLPIGMETAGSVYGTTINQSAIAQGSSDPIQHEGVLTTGNRSLTNQVFTLNNQSRMAYIARLSVDIPTDVSFIAPTLGVESTCIPITAACFSQTPQDPNSDYTPYNCSPAGYPDYYRSNKYTAFDTLAVPSRYLSNPNDTSGLLSLKRNPFPIFNINIMYDINFGLFLFLACNISVYDTVLQHSHGVYTMLNRTLSTPESASVVTRPLSVYVEYTSMGENDDENDDWGFPLLAILQSDISYLAHADGRGLGDFVAADISRLLLSYSAGYLSTNPAHSMANQGVITRYNMTSLAITLLLVSLYSLLAFVIFGWASTAHVKPASHLRLTCEVQSHVVSTQGLVYNAQLRLTRPSTLVPHALYGRRADHKADDLPPCPAGYVVSKEIELFEGLDFKHCDRLAITRELGVNGSSDVKTRMCAVGHDQDAASKFTGASGSSLTFPGAETLRMPSNTTAGDIPVVPNSHQQYRMPFSGRFTALMVFLASSMLATSIICWLYIRRYRAPDGGTRLNPLYPYITVKEPSRSSDVDADGTVLVGLLISSITTQFVALTAPLLLVAVAYRVAIDWLECSGHLNLPKLPTPQQYGHLINLFSVGGLGVLLEVGGYLKDRTNRAQAPRMLLGAFVAATVIFVSTHIVGLADLTLHSTTTTGTLSSANVVDPSESFYYGTVPRPFDPSPFNHTLDYCVDGPDAPRLEGIMTASDRSAVNSVLTYESDDQMAYITRAEGLIPAGVSFIAPSLGISAQCTSITQNCTSTPHSFKTNCSGYPEITHFTAEQFVVYGDQWSGSDVQNPFKAFWQMPFTQIAGDYQFNDLLASSRGAIFLIVACNVTVYDILLHYTNGSYTLVNKTIASGATAAYATYPLYHQDITPYSPDLTSFPLPMNDQLFPIMPRLADDLIEMNSSAADFAAAFSPDVARMLLAFSAGVFQSAPAAQVMKDGIVTRYSLIPLAIYLFSVYLYALLALGIFVWAAFSGHKSAGTMGAKKLVGGYRLASDFGSAPSDESPGQARELVIKAQWHVSQPSSLVAALFGGTRGREEEGEHDVDDDAHGEHTDEKRLAVRLHEQIDEDGSNKRQVYGVGEVTQGFKEAQAD